MSALTQQTHDIVIYPNQKRVFWMRSMMVLAFLLIISLDTFVIWAFWKHYEIDTSAYVAALIASIATLFMGWATFTMLSRFHWQGPVITINAEGFYVEFPLRFTFSPRVKQSFIPWREIEWITSFRSGRNAWLSFSLKDPAHYWSLYGQGKYRTWRRSALTGAHINIVQSPLSLSAPQILQRIEENYRAELIRYEVKVKF